MDKKSYFIRAEWDNEARVWVASSEDIPGLVTEDSTLEVGNTEPSFVSRRKEGYL